MPTIDYGYGYGYSLAEVDVGTLRGLSAAAANYGALAVRYADEISNAVSGLVAPTINPRFPTVTNAPAIMTAAPPALMDVIWELQNAPVPFTETLTLSDYLPAPFDATPPLMVFGTAPTQGNDILPAAPGITTDYTYPTLDLALPLAPTLMSLSVIPFTGVDMPMVDYTVPTLTAVEPSLQTYVPGASYSSSLLTLVKNSLTDRIENGTGLPPAVENAIWDRGREREARAKQDAILSLERMESMGFAFPPGVYMDARLKIETESEATAAGLSREIMIKQAELALQGVTTAIASATQLEGQLIAYSNQSEQRLFESAKYATEAGISIYNAKVQAYGAYVDAYKVKVQVYEAQVRGELARVEAYKVQVSAEEAKAQINTALVQQYKVQADVALANVDVFKAEIAAIQSKAEIEKLKVEIYGEQVKGYTAKINAYTAGVEGYRASVQAEATKQDAFKSQVQAYTAQVEAGVKQIQAQIDAYRAKIEAKSSEYDGFKAAAAAATSRAQAIASSNQSLTDAYKGQVASVGSYNDAVTKQWQAAIDQAQGVVQIGVAAAKANGELYISTRSLALDGAKAGAQALAQLAAAAYSGISYAQSVSNSKSISESDSSSSSTSYSEIDQNIQTTSA